MKKQIQQTTEVALHDIIQKRETLEEVKKYFIMNSDLIHKYLNLCTCRIWIIISKQLWIQLKINQDHGMMHVSNVQDQSLKHKMV